MSKKTFPDVEFHSICKFIEKWLVFTTGHVAIAPDAIFTCFNNDTITMLFLKLFDKNR